MSQGSGSGGRLAASGGFPLRSGGTDGSGGRGGGGASSGGIGGAAGGFGGIFAAGGQGDVGGSPSSGGQNSSGGSSGGMGTGGGSPEPCSPGTFLDFSSGEATCTACPQLSYSDGYDQQACEPHSICWLTEDVSRSATPTSDVVCKPMLFGRNLDLVSPGSTQLADLDIQGNLLYVVGSSQGTFPGDTGPAQKAYLAQVSRDDASLVGLDYFGGVNEPAYLTAVRVDTSGAVNLCGFTYASLFGPQQSTSDTFFVRRDVMGTIDAQQWGSNPYDQVANCRMALFPDGHVALSDTAFLPSTSQTYTRIFSREPGGNIVSHGAFPETFIQGLVEGPLDSLLAAATVFDTPNTGMVARFDSYVVQVWTTGWGSSYGPASAVALSQEGRLFVTAGQGGAYVLELDPQTGFLKNAIQLNQNVYELSDLAVGPDDHLYVVGTTYGDVTGKNGGATDVVVAAVTLDGTVEWIQQYGANDQESGFRIAVADNNDIYIGGGAYSSTMDGAFVRLVLPPQN